MDFLDQNFEFFFFVDEKRVFIFIYLFFCPFISKRDWIDYSNTFPNLIQLLIGTLKVGVFTGIWSINPKNTVWAFESDSCAM